MGDGKIVKLMTVKGEVFVALRDLECEKNRKNHFFSKVFLHKCRKEN